jgi:hypothetical protein
MNSFITFRDVVDGNGTVRIIWSAVAVVGLP